MTTYTFSNDTISDLYKEVYGFRPSAGFWQRWNELADENKQLLWDSLVEALEEQIADQKIADERAIEAFEQDLLKIQRTTGGSRNEAIVYYVESLDMTFEDIERYGASYICYEAGLPYSLAQTFVDAGAANQIG